MPPPINLKQLIQSTLVRNVVIVATGTAGAQAITMAFAPLISRMYGPEAFGELGSFISILAILTPLAALTYPIAIVLPKADSEAIGLVQISITIAAAITAVTTLLVLTWGDAISSVLQLRVIIDLWPIIPAAMFVSALRQILEHWLIRHRKFKANARAAVIQSLSINLSKVLVDLAYTSGSTLALLTAAGIAWHVFLLWLATRTQKSLEIFPKVRKKDIPRLLDLARRHIDFPLYRAPQVTISAFSQGLPILSLAAFFGPAAAGYYTLGQTVLALPTNLIGKSVSDAIYPRISEASQNGEDLTRLLILSTSSLALVGLVPFGLIMAFGPDLFTIIFGIDWYVAGKHAQWLALWMFFNFINKPAVAAIPSLKLQSWLLKYEIVSSGTKALALYIGFTVFNSDTYAIALVCSTGVAAYALLILVALNKSYSQARILKASR